MSKGITNLSRNVEHIKNKYNFIWVMFSLKYFPEQIILIWNHIGGVMVVVLVGSSPGRFEPKIDYKIGICCFSTKRAALRSKSKDWLARNQNNVSK